MSRKRRIHETAFHICCILLLILMLYPIVWLAFSSFKNSTEIFGGIADIIPKNWTLENFKNGWKGFGGTSFATFFKNSFIVSIGATVLSVFGSIFVAYGFARINFKGRGIWFACMIMTLMLPVQVLMIPQYMLFSKLKWINTYYPLIIPYLGGYAFFIYLDIQFLRGIPRELDEAARIDGCNELMIFSRIMMPLTKSAMVTSAIFSFYWRWEDFVGPLLYLKKPKLYTVSIALKLFSDPNSVTDWGAMFSMSFLSLIPACLVFLFFQKYIVEGISTSGLKA